MHSLFLDFGIYSINVTNLSENELTVEIPHRMEIQANDKQQKMTKPAITKKKG